MTGVSDRIHDRYDLVERLAVGGMAEVFLARAYGAHGFAKTLAIKRILPELARDREFEERFIAEAKLAVQLNHANVVQVFDFGRFSDSLFIAMEYVDGLDLAALLAGYRKRDECIPLPAAFRIAIDIARGLDFAHDRGVIHRDVSPSNILLSRAGEVKITDFGIALTGTEELARSSHRIMGKWRYMAPEQTRGEPLDTRSDVFAAAAVMYELFLGQKLFAGSEVEEIVDNIHHMEIPKISQKRAGLPTELDDVLRGALERDPDKRTPHASDIQHALTEISYKSSIVATPREVEEAVALISQKRRPVSIEVRNSGNSGKVAIDDLIKQQLLGEADRHTEQGTEPEPRDRPATVHTRPEERTLKRPATMVRTGVGEDGLRVWTLDNGEKGAAKTSRRPIVLGLIAIAVLGSAFVVIPRITRSEAVKLPVTTAASDAGPPAPVREPQPGMLTITSDPPGAQVRIDGAKLPDLTPASTQVSPGQEHRVEVAMTGYLPFVHNPAVVGEGQSSIVHAELEPLPASLEVTTQPSMAVVKLGDRVLGITPLSADDLTPGPAQTVTIDKKGYEPVTFSIDLPPGKRVVTERKLTLKRARGRPTPVVYGYIDLHIEGSWAEVYLGRQKVGQAPVRHLRLPQGNHRLRLHNPVSKKTGFLNVEVIAGQSKYYSTKL